MYDVKKLVAKTTGVEETVPASTITVFENAPPAGKTVVCRKDGVLIAFTNGHLVTQAKSDNKEINVHFISKYALKESTIQQKEENQNEQERSRSIPHFRTHSGRETEMGTHGRTTSPERSRRDCGRDPMLSLIHI